MLQRLQPLAADRVSPAQVCAVADEVQALLEAAYEQAVPAMADIARTFSAAQIDHLAKPYNRELQEAQRDYLQPDEQERQEAALKRVVDRAESVYGSLDESQRALLAAGLEGIEQKLELEPEFSGDVYSAKNAREIPHNLRDAAAALLGSKMLRKALGDDVVEHYHHAAQWEILETDRVVTDFELQRLLERA